MPKSKPAASPKYRVILDELKKQIAKGALKPGDRLPSFVEMRARYNVTPTTVTRVYSQLQAENLITCERGRGSFVAHRTTKKTSGIIGLAGSIFEHYLHPYNAALMRGLMRGAAQHEVKLLLMNSAVTAHDWEGVDGAIISEPAGLDDLLSLPPQFPCVLALYTSPQLVSVVADDYDGVRQIMQHLLALGHRRIAMIIDPLSTPRVSAYRDALHEDEISPNALWVRRIKNKVSVEDNLYYAETTYDLMKKWLVEDWKKLGCTALIAQNDDSANGAIEALREAGLRVPEDVSVTGFDGTRVSRFLRPALTTVKVPLEEIGRTSMDLLMRQIHSEYSQPFTHTLPVQLMASDSTAPPRKK